MAIGHILITGAGLLGAAGVALSARASHGGGETLGVAAQFMLLHAPVLLVLGTMLTNRTAQIAGLVMLVSVLVFALDLVARHYWGERLFPFAAPLGGSGMILAWLGIAASAFWIPR